MKYHPGASYLIEEDWYMADKLLSPFESALAPLAERLNLEIQIDKRWPGLKLKKRSFREYRSYRLVLNSQYLEDRVLLFQLLHEATQLGGSRKSKYAIKTTELATYTPEQLQNVEMVVSDITERISLTKNVKNVI